MTPERALIRLRQITTEEKAAVSAGNIDELCRLSELLPSAIAELASACETSGSQAAATTAEQLDEIRTTHHVIERYIESEMRAITTQLQQFSKARTTLRAYGRMASDAQLDNRV